jgi:16S rRNA (cytosine967-C5)-methyltransferase
VWRFLEEHREFEIEPAGEFLPEAVVNGDGFLRTYPHLHGVDGIFAAKMRKVGSHIR